ncbi:MAG: hypothetical protein LBF65_01580 [Holosporales bacterium]|jgi:hypothetical protein|nr:hypothetical protein [Holosporales bacterium]
MRDLLPHDPVLAIAEKQVAKIQIVSENLQKNIEAVENGRIKTEYFEVNMLLIKMLIGDIYDALPG